MGNLPRHFGTDASLDAATTAALSAWLSAHAGTRKKATVAAAAGPHLAGPVVRARTP
jgi:hypothetical protein